MHIGIEDQNGNILEWPQAGLLFEVGKTYTPACLESLEIACRAYFETYQATKGNTLGPPISYNGQVRFIQLSRQTILYFHHFFELAIKDILRLEHPLLASRLEEAKDEKLLHVLRNEYDSDKDLKSVEFGEALDRLAKCSHVPGSKLNVFRFIDESRELLVKLNRLRNRIWHRGRVFVSLDELDQMVGSKLLPLALKIVSANPFEGLPDGLRLTPLCLQTSPAAALCEAWGHESKPEEWKICLIKELGRVSLERRLHILPHPHNSEVSEERVRRIAEARAEFDGYGSELNKEAPGVRTCPACAKLGLITTVWTEGDFVTVDVEWDGEMFHEDRQFRPHWAKFVEVECVNCRLCLNALEFPTSGEWQGFNFGELFWESSKHY